MIGISTCNENIIHVEERALTNQMRLFGKISVQVAAKGVIVRAEVQKFFKRGSRAFSYNNG